MAHVAKNATKYKAMVDAHQALEEKKAILKELMKDELVLEAAEAVKGLKILITPTILREVMWVDEEHDGELLSKLGDVFGEDVDAMATFFREVAGVKTHIGKAAATYTSDSVRFGGISAEAVLDATGDFISWAFHMAGDGIRIGTDYVGKGIDKLAGGRPEEVEDVNLVEEAVMPHVEKAGDWFRNIRKKAAKKLAGEKKQETTL